MKLSPTASYYIRKLLRQSADTLRSVVASSAGVKADGLSDLDEVLTNLYLDEAQVWTVARQLEDLAYVHKTLDAQTSIHSAYLHSMADIEQKIFWLLGLRKVSPQ